MNTGHSHDTRFWYVFGFARNYSMIIPITFIRESPGITIVQPKREQFCPFLSCLWGCNWAKVAERSGYLYSPFVAVLTTMPARNIFKPFDKNELNITHLFWHLQLCIPVLDLHTCLDIDQIQSPPGNLALLPNSSLVLRDGSCNETLLSWGTLIYHGLLVNFCGDKGKIKRLNTNAVFQEFKIKKGINLLLVYTIETFNFSKCFPGRFLSSKATITLSSNAAIHFLCNLSYLYKNAFPSRCLSNTSLMYRAHVPGFSDQPARRQRVATDSLGNTPLLDMHSLIIKVVAIPCNKENSWIRWWDCG